MSEGELQAALAITNENITRDEAEYSTLHARMTRAAEAGDDAEWMRLQGVHGVLPTKVTGQKLRALSIRILLTQAQLEAAAGACTALSESRTAEVAQERFDEAKRALDEAIRAQMDAGEEANNYRRNLAELKHERGDLQAAATKPRRAGVL
jgi:chromosome segregation ATPase